MKIDIENTGPVLDALYEHVIPEDIRELHTPVGKASVKNDLLTQFLPGIEALLKLVNEELARRTASLQEILEEAERDLQYTDEKEGAPTYQTIEGYTMSVRGLVAELKAVLG